MLILDTDLLTIVQRKEGDAYACLAARLVAATSIHPVCVTVITFEEQMRGWLAYLARSRSIARQVEGYARLQLFMQDFSNRQVLPFDGQAASLYEELVRSRVRIGTMDLKVAAIALAHDTTLLSRNLRDFRKVPGLRVEDWTVPATT